MADDWHVFEIQRNKLDSLFFVRKNESFVSGSFDNFKDALKELMKLRDAAKLPLTTT